MYLVRKGVFENILTAGGLHVFTLSLIAGPIPEPFPHAMSIKTVLFTVYPGELNLGKVNATATIPSCE